MNKHIVDNGAMLNLYPDSLNGNLKGAIDFLQNSAVSSAFHSAYILPSIFNSDLDRGFSVIDYGINELYAEEADLSKLKKLNIDLKLDFVLNHISVLSKQFLDLLRNGDNSKYKDFFIHWNRFWQGCGKMTADGYIQPDEKYLKQMFFRKPGLPILMVRMPDGTDQPYWNTFYKQINYQLLNAHALTMLFNMQFTVAEKISTIVNDALAQGIEPKEICFGKFDRYKNDIINHLMSSRTYLGQMDLNIRSPLVWEYYEDTLRSLSNYGAAIVRLDAFAYAPKEVGAKNFLNDPATWELLAKVNDIASKYTLQLLPEIHAGYEEKIYEKIALQGYMGYDFFLPGLILDALERKQGNLLCKWANELQDKKIKVINMLGCHDGIPLLDLKGLLPENDINKLIKIVVNRGGYVKNLHGQKNIYYQVNATYYSALGENDKKMLLARAIQLFMPGKPQVWYLDLFAGKNNHDAVAKAGAGGHKEINRTNLTKNDIENLLTLDIVKKQLSLLHMRNSFPAFGFDAKMSFNNLNDKLFTISWQKNEYIASLNVNLSDYNFEIKLTNTKEASESILML